MAEKQEERNKNIYKRALAGDRLKVIAADNNVSVGRVQQIVEHYKSGWDERKKELLTMKGENGKFIILSTREANGLRRAEIKTLEQLSETPQATLLRIKNFSWKSYMSILAKMEKVGLTMNKPVRE